MGCACCGQFGPGSPGNGGGGLHLHSFTGHWWQRALELGKLLLEYVQNVLTHLVEIGEAFLESLDGRGLRVRLDPEVDLHFAWMRYGVSAEDDVRVLHDDVAQRVGQRVVLIVEHKRLAVVIVDDAYFAKDFELVDDALLNN